MNEPVAWRKMHYQDGNALGYGYFDFPVEGGEPLYLKEEPKPKVLMELQVLAEELKIGDELLNMWFHQGRKVVIVDITPYDGRLSFLYGSLILHFASHGPCTAERGSTYRIKRWT